MEDTTKEEIENTNADAIAGGAEMQTLAAENERLKKELRIRSAVYDVGTRLAAAGAITPGLLAQKAEEDFQFAENGDLTNPEALVGRLRRAYPEQFGRDIPHSSIDAGAGRNVSPPLTRDALSRMSVAEVQRLDWDEIKEVLTSK